MEICELQGQNPILGTCYTVHEKDSQTFKQIPEVPANNPYVQSYNLQSYWSKNESDTCFSYKVNDSSKLGLSCWRMWIHISGNQYQKP